ncbi:hypothetical protein CHGG_04140 [Chaetomium globosum CBS 148.51]|uniref:Thioredoxin n=1 Tax=Chaetomium globosum (strain ATCC 6205 / CBS 148.51 / DSM 1962 / NBRC 6347 / NRRL 1970) TaxID=306901 RepID=Q2H256_CHAGB|nr:uncharacterized protein CHGG_04140 [Chaetomium globosum CBS 148.51]EAQ87521.1 hypothetical protein CHGG_04140 [Chaetomium globosum CBS 148.51]
MTVHEIHSVVEFRDIISQNPMVAIDASAVWCGPCKFISPLFEKYIPLHGSVLELSFKDRVYFAKFDVDGVSDLAQELGIRAMPTFTFFRDGQKMSEFAGADPKRLAESLAELSQ